MGELHKQLLQLNFYPRPPRGGRPPPGVLTAPTKRISIHALREEGDLTCLHRSGAAHNFYPRPPRGGRRPCAHCSPLGGRISIHALREEGDEGRGGQFCSLDIFLSTPSARRATWHHRHVYGPQRISIHALREEGDPGHGDKSGAVRNFYPRPPRGGRLLIAHPPCTYLTFLSTPSARRATRGTSMKAATKTLFLSTPSARRATGAARAAERSRQYFYPRPPRGGRRLRQCLGC